MSGTTLLGKITVQSNSANPIGYKFKTNAPARYSVKPVLGVLEPHCSINILVRTEGNINATDRFLIQTVSLTSDESLIINSNTWKQLDRSRLYENFIDCKIDLNNNFNKSNSSSPSDKPIPNIYALGSPRSTTKSTASLLKTPSGTPQKSNFNNKNFTNNNFQKQELLHNKNLKFYERNFIQKFSINEIIIFSLLFFITGIFFPYQKLLFFNDSLHAAN
ncbi:hypothetical protein HDU92_007010 [Lobulomyces angularis]|nr:hypothetical protein HDU92_007010 [Lobulomyces angularis]